YNKQKVVMELEFGNNNPFIDEGSKENGDKIMNESSNYSMEEECLFQPEENNLEELIEAEKNNYKNTQSGADNSEENQIDNATQIVKIADAKDLIDRQVTVNESQKIDGTVL
ncbi:2632_t:CDS:1, partial [Gigaspora margarita]